MNDPLIEIAASDLHRPLDLPPGPSATESRTASHGERAAPALPEGGIAAVPISDALRHLAHLLARIRIAARGSQAEFERLYVPVVQSYAHYVHLLPCARSGPGSEPGAALRLGLETAFHSLQASGGVIFSCRERAEARRILEPRWRYATFVAGLCAELGGLVDRLAVYDVNGEPWPAHRLSLHDWLGAGRGRYFPRWLDRAAIGASGPDGIVLGQILPKEGLRYLCEGGEQIVAAMLSAIAAPDAAGDTSALGRIVAHTRARLGARANTSVKLPSRAGPESSAGLADAMRSLFRNGTWKVNQRKARLWYGSDGLFLVWKTAANEIAAHSDRCRKGNAQTMGEDLAAAGVFDRNADGNYLCIIRPPGAVNDLVAARIAAPDWLLAGADPEPRPLGCALRCAPQSGASAVRR